MMIIRIDYILNELTLMNLVTRERYRVIPKVSVKRFSLGRIK